VVKSLLPKFYGHHHELVNWYGISIPFIVITTMYFTIQDLPPVSNKSSTMDATSGAGTAYPNLGSTPALVGFLLLPNL
jgi:hypothetical protein